MPQASMQSKPHKYKSITVGSGLGGISGLLTIPHDKEYQSEARRPQGRVQLLKLRIGPQTLEAPASLLTALSLSMSQACIAEEVRGWQ